MWRLFFLQQHLAGSNNRVTNDVHMLQENLLSRLSTQGNRLGRVLSWVYSDLKNSNSHCISESGKTRVPRSLLLRFVHETGSSLNFSISLREEIGFERVVDWNATAHLNYTANFTFVEAMETAVLFPRAKGPMRTTIFAIRFEDGVWRDWEQLQR